MTEGALEKASSVRLNSEEQKFWDKLVLSMFPSATPEILKRADALVLARRERLGGVDQPVIEQLLERAEKYRNDLTELIGLVKSLPRCQREGCSRLATRMEPLWSLKKLVSVYVCAGCEASGEETTLPWAGLVHWLESKEIAEAEGRR